MAGVKGKSGGDRRSKKAQGVPDSAPLPVTTAGYDRLIRVLNLPPAPDETNKDPEAAGFRKAWDSGNPSIALNTRKFLYMMRDGNPRHTVNHLHDKPIEVNHTFSIAAELREARERAVGRREERERAIGQRSVSDA
jgi:hypothetical protein